MMTECKEFGWIDKAVIEFAEGAAQLRIELAGDDWGTTSCTPVDMACIITLMQDARVTEMNQLVGKPITATFTYLGGTLVEWNIFTPVVKK